MLFEDKCVLAVCVHNYPVMTKIHPILFLILINHKQVLQNKPFSESEKGDITFYKPRPQLLTDNAVSHVF